jgi:SAM-dependent methyltransferase
MAIGREVVEADGVTAGYVREYDRLSEDRFSSFFFDEADLAASIRAGAWDFSFHIAGKCMPFLHVTDSVLDVGCGAGRMLLHAARHFDRAYGIDLHRRGDLIEHYGRELGVENASYQTFDGRTFPFESDAFDLIYCIYVLTYVGTPTTIHAILSEIKRTLRAEGAAVVYYGVRSTIGNDRSSWFADCLDRFLERFPPWRTPFLRSAPVNLKNLGMPEPIMLRLCRSCGLRVVATGRSLRLCRGRRHGGQRFVILKHASRSGRNGGIENEIAEI